MDARSVPSSANQDPLDVAPVAALGAKKGSFSLLSADTGARQQSFRSLSKPQAVAAAAASSAQVAGSTRAQWLAAKESELQHRESIVAEAEQQVAELSTLREDAERHANELTLKEASLREKERLHGALEERALRINEREEDLARWEAELEKRAGQCVLREAELERASEERMRKYESLVKPLAERERLCLEQEEELHRVRQETMALCRRDEERVQQLRELTSRREAEVRDMKRAVFEQRARLERRETEIESLKEEVSEYLRAQKKKNDELYERTRALEWKENDGEVKMRQLRDQAVRQQQQGEELVRQAEEQKLVEAKLREQQAAADELRADLATKRRRLLLADDEVRNLERLARDRGVEAEQQIEAAEARVQAAGAAEAGLQEREEGLVQREKAVDQREQEVAAQEKKAVATRRRLAAAQQELLEWMRQTEWRERQMNAGGDKSSRLGAPLLIPAEQPRNETLPPADCSPGALVTWQLKQMKDKYLGAAAKRSREKDKPAAPREDIFEVALDEIKEIEGLEGLAKRAAGTCARYFAKLRVLHTLRDKLPLTAADAIGRRDLTDVDRKIVSAFSTEEQLAIRAALELEQSTRKEIYFLSEMNSAPLLKRLNAQQDADVILDMEVWYKRWRRHLHDRYINVLKERAMTLNECATLFEQKESSQKDLFEKLVVRGDVGALSTEFTALTSREQHSVRHRTAEARVKALASSHHQRAPPPPLSRSQDKPRPATRSVVRAKRLMPLQLALHQARVAMNKPPPDHVYLRQYFEHDDEDVLMNPRRSQPLQVSAAGRVRAPRRKTVGRKDAKSAELPPMPPSSQQQQLQQQHDSDSDASARRSEAPGGDGGEDPPSRPGSGAPAVRRRASSAGSSGPLQASRASDGRPPPVPPPPGSQGDSDGPGDDGSRSAASDSYSEDGSN